MQVQNFQEKQLSCLNFRNRCLEETVRKDISRTNKFWQVHARNRKPRCPPKTNNTKQNESYDSHQKNFRNYKSPGISTLVLKKSWKRWASKSIIIHTCGTESISIIQYNTEFSRSTARLRWSSSRQKVSNHRKLDQYLSKSWRDLIHLLRVILLWYWSCRFFHWWWRFESSFGLSIQFLVVVVDVLPEFVVVALMSAPSAMMIASIRVTEGLM